jgi:hypothetical protein
MVGCPNVLWQPFRQVGAKLFANYLGLCLSQTMVFPLLKAKSLEIDAEKKIATATPSGCKEKFREKKVRTG